MKLHKYLKIIFLCLVFITQNAFSQNRFWGMTESQEGSNQPTYIYSVDNNGIDFRWEYTVRRESNGVSPFGIVADSIFIYGLASEGGTKEHGSIFRYNTIDSTIIFLANFDGINGTHPTIKMTKASNGKFYSLTTEGGMFNLGVLYEFNPITNQITKKADFDGTTNGQKPTHPLLLANNGMLYGSTTYGGTNGFGVIFEYDPIADTLKIVHNFSSGYGVNPLGNLAKHGNKVYGMCLSDKSFLSNGYIFEYDYSSNTYSNKLSFNPLNSILANPISGFSNLGQDTLIGITAFNFTPYYYAIIKYIPATNTFTYCDFYNFGALNPQNLSITQFSNSNIYITTSDGFSAYKHMIMKYIPSLDTVVGINVNTLYYNAVLSGEPVEINGLIYFSNICSGYDKNGLLVAVDSSFNNERPICYFYYDGGEKADGSMLFASNSKFYSVFSVGDKYGYGGILKYDPITKIHKNIPFRDDSGVFPVGKLVETNGKIYGICHDASTMQVVIYSVDYLTDSIFIEYVLPNSFGSDPDGKILVDSKGSIVGYTQNGGVSNKGVVFEYSPINDTAYLRGSFGGISLVKSPIGGLIETAPGIFYGVSLYGGNLSIGNIYKCDTYSNSIENVFKCSPFVGLSDPISLFKTSQGAIYGLATNSSIGNASSLFEFDTLNNSVSHLVSNPGNLRYASSIVENSNNQLFIVSTSGGVNNTGSIIQLNPSNLSSSIAHSFGLDSIKYPMPVLNFGPNLTSIEYPIQNKELNIRLYPNPTSSVIIIESLNTVVIDYIEIYSTDGKLIKRLNFENFKSTINIQEYVAGVYLLIIHTKVGKTIYRVVKK
jgi:uncharacterized repeat protein (TIGR03803 family)